MSRIMVCVTKQKTCQRLIDYGKSLMTSEDDTMHIIHVTGLDYTFLDDSEDGRALDYLYEKAREAGAELLVLKSDDVLETLTDIVKDNKIDKVVVGSSHEAKGFDGFIDNLRNEIKGSATVYVCESADDTRRE